MRTIDIDLSSEMGSEFLDGIIRVGENDSTKLSAKILSDWEGYTYSIISQLNENIPITSDDLTPVDGVIEYVIPSTLTTEKGLLKVQVIASDIDGIIMKSAVFGIKVFGSIS